MWCDDNSDNDDDGNNHDDNDDNKDDDTFDFLFRSFNIDHEASSIHSSLRT